MQKHTQLTHELSPALRDEADWFPKVTVRIALKPELLLELDLFDCKLLRHERTNQIAEEAR